MSRVLAGRLRALSIVSFLAVSAVLLWGVAATNARPVPARFFGVVPQGELGEADFDRMQGVVGTLRIPFYWYEIEPRPGVYDFARLDAVVGEAADRGIAVLPFVYGSPRWATGSESVPPLRGRARADWLGVLRRLVRRYGPRGEFWRGRDRRLPIRRWQIWNEPNFLLFWRPQPSPHDYAELLEGSARTIRAADPGATVIAAGVAPVEGGISPWSFLRRLYRQPGVRGAFDVLALHPYAPHVAWVADEIRFVRKLMAEAGDAHTPLQLTEIGVASGGDRSDAFDLGRHGQASYLRRVLALALRNRGRWHLSGLDWFTWRDASGADPHCGFCQHSGLFDPSGEPKPAWSAFRAAATSPH
jgi:polysaccharide biosynthesis protein PslG